MIKDLAPARRRKLNQQARFEYGMDYAFVLCTGVLIGMAIMMMADAI